MLARPPSCTCCSQIASPKPILPSIPTRLRSPSAIFSSIHTILEATCKHVKLGRSTVALLMGSFLWLMQQISKDLRSQRRNSIVCWRCLSFKTCLSSFLEIKSIRMAAWKRRSLGKCWDYITTQPMARMSIRRMLVRDLSKFLCARSWREWAMLMDSSGWALS